MNKIKELLRSKDLRPTDQRLMVGGLLFDGTDKHVTAESIYRDLKKRNQKISLATVYNTLHDLSNKKLLEKVTIDPKKVYFDTNTESHYHFYYDDKKTLIDIPKNNIIIKSLPKAPKGKSIKNVEIIVHLKNK